MYTVANATFPSGRELAKMSLDNRKSLSPWIKDEVKYYRHQVEGVRHLARRRSFILGDDMGLGKSLQALTVFGIDVYRGWCKTAIIVCPTTLKGNWADEIEKFTTFPYVLLEGTPDQRIRQLVEFSAIGGPKILITHYEQIVAHREQLEAFDFDVAIFDEAHYLKNPKAKRTEACMELYSRRSFMLTGTPMLNHVNELWTLLHRCAPDQFPDYWKFVNRYCVFGGYKNKQIIGVKNEPQLSELLQNYMLRRLKSEVLDLPEVQYTERRVDLTPEQLKLYNEVISDMKLTRFNANEPDDIENALTKFLRLKEICGTTYKFTGKDISSKLDLSISDTEELIENGHKLVVFTQFRDVQACYAKRAMELDVPIWELHGDVKKPDRSPMVKEWAMTNAPGIIVCMLQIAGIGLNMTAARHAFFLDKLFVPGLNQQAVDRLHRIGSSKTQPVQVFEYLARGTIENRVNQILRTKKKVFMNIVETDPDWKRKLVQILLKEEAA